MGVRDAIDEVFRREHGVVFAALVRALGDWELAEDALMDALQTALERWPADGVPDNPAAWLTTTARRRAIDRIRRRQVRVAHADAVRLDALRAAEERQEADVPDDRLRLLFTCCHPALALDAQVALTLRTLCGLGTPQIARAFLVPEPTMAQRLVRAQRKIRDAGIPYRVPEGPERDERVDGVLVVIYLVFTEGYGAPDGASERSAICDEALALGETLVALLPDHPEALALLALMRLQHARRATRVDGHGAIVLLEDQDRSRWDRAAIADGIDLLRRATALGGPAGPYLLQARIAAVHAASPSAAGTAWPAIEGLYAALFRLTGSPVVALNHGVAIAMARGVPAGLAHLDDPALAEALDGYHLYHAARADLLRRAGRPRDAAAAYTRALSLADDPAERAFLERRHAEVADS